MTHIMEVVWMILTEQAALSTILTRSRKMKLLSETRPFPWSCLIRVWLECPMDGEFSMWRLVIVDIKPFTLATTATLVAPNQIPRSFLCIPWVNRKPNITQMRLITNAAMTCSPDQSQDFVVAANCLGLEIHFFRPGGKHHNYSGLGFKTDSHYFDQSKVMYSKRDQKFYTPSVGGHFLGFWDSCFEDLTGSKMRELRFCNLPEVTQSEWELLDSCSPPTAHLVEAPSGQRFLVKWYAQNYKPGQKMTFLCSGTKRFMVFREEEDMNMCYTEDIGDLCIFLGRSEPFCVKASSFPGLNPNSIYFAGEGFGVYDIATRKPRSFRPKSPSAFSRAPVFPYWIPPMPL